MNSKANYWKFSRSGRYACLSEESERRHFLSHNVSFDVVDFERKERKSIRLNIPRTCATVIYHYYWIDDNNFVIFCGGRSVTKDKQLFYSIDLDSKATSYHPVSKRGLQGKISRKQVCENSLEINDTKYCVFLEESAQSWRDISENTLLISDTCGYFQFVPMCSGSIAGVPEVPFNFTKLWQAKKGDSSNHPKLHRIFASGGGIYFLSGYLLLKIDMQKQFKYWVERGLLNHDDTLVISPDYCEMLHLPNIEEMSLCYPRPVVNDQFFVLCGNRLVLRSFEEGIILEIVFCIIDLQTNRKSRVFTTHFDTNEGRTLLLHPSGQFYQYDKRGLGQENLAIIRPAEPRPMEKEIRMMRRRRLPSLQTIASEVVVKNMFFDESKKQKPGPIVHTIVTGNG